MQDDTFFQEHKVGGFLSDIFDDLAGFVYFVKDVELRYVAFNSRLNEIFDIENGWTGLRLLKSLYEMKRVISVVS